MTHLSEDNLMRLAEIAEEDLSYSDSELEMMDHLKTCVSCYEKFCSALALLSVTSESGYVVLSEMYALKREENPIKQISNKILAAVNFAINRLAENVDVVLDQVKSASAAFFFQPSLAMATRGLSESGQGIYKVEDINDEKTFIAVDPVSRNLLIQINTKELGNIRIRAFLQLEGGGMIEIQLQQKGKIYKGQISDFPSERFQIIVEECE